MRKIIEILIRLLYQVLGIATSLKVGVINLKIRFQSLNIDFVIINRILNQTFVYGTGAGGAPH